MPISHGLEEQINLLELEEIEIIGDSASGDWSPPPTFALAHPGNWGQWLFDGVVQGRKRSGWEGAVSDKDHRFNDEHHSYNVADFITTHHLDSDPGLT